MNFPLKTAFIVALVSAATAGQLYAQQTRFQGMDRNRDGVITRSEWRGNDTSFNNEDWNGDGVLSGDEVRPGARKPAYAGNIVRDWNLDGTINQQDAVIGQRFGRRAENARRQRGGDPRGAQLRFLTSNGERQPVG